jgi:hypothetical protein
MGDSVTAASGASSVNLLQALIENTSLSFAISEEKEGPPRCFSEEVTNRIHHPDCRSHVDIYINITGWRHVCSRTRRRVDWWRVIDASEKLPASTFKVYTKGGQLEELWDQHFMRQCRHETCPPKITIYSFNYLRILTKARKLYKM